MVSGPKCWVARPKVAIRSGRKRRKTKTDVAAAAAYLQASQLSQKSSAADPTKAAPAPPTNVHAAKSISAAALGDTLPVLPLDTVPVPVEQDQARLATPKKSNGLQS